MNGTPQISQGTIWARHATPCIISPVNYSDRRAQDLVPPIKRVGGEQIISHSFLAPLIEDATVIVLEKADAR